MNDFFISYTKADRNWAEWISWQLEVTGYKVIFQEWDFRPGGDFIDEIKKANESAQTTIAVLSEEYFNNKYPLAELTIAVSKDPDSKTKNLIPVRISNVSPKGSLSSVTYINLYGIRDEEEAVEALLEGIKKERGKPVLPPQYPPSEKHGKEKPLFPIETPTIITSQATSLEESEFSSFQNKHIEHIPFPGEGGVRQNMQLVKRLNDAKEIAENSEVSKAIEIYDTLLISERNLNVLNDYAKLFFRIGDLEHAEKYFDEIVANATMDNNIGWISRANANLAMVHQSKGDLNKALRLLETSRWYNKKINHKAGIADNLRHKADILRVKGDVRLAKEIYKDALNQFGKIPYKPGIADTCSNLAMAIKLLGDYETSILFQEKSLVINKDENRKSCQADNYSELGSIYRITGDLKKAEDAINKSLSINRSLKRKHGLAEDLGRLGLIRLYMGDDMTAEEYLVEALRMSRELPNIEKSAKHLANLGRLEWYKGNFSTANSHLEEALGMNESIEAKNGIACVNYIYGGIYLSLRDWTKSEVSTSQAIAIWQFMGNKKGVADCNELLSMIYKNREQYENAEIYCRRAITESNNIGANISLASALQTHGSLYEVMRDTDSAIQEYKKAKTLFSQNGEMKKLKKINEKLDEI